MSELADQMDPPISESRARAYKSVIDNKEDCEAVEQGPFGKYYLVAPDGNALRIDQTTQEAATGPLNPGLSPSEKSARTKQAKEVTRDMQLWLNTMLQQVDPCPLPEPTSAPGAQDVILLRGDDHIGQKATIPLEDGSISTIYDTEIAINTIEYVTEQVPAILASRKQETETLHYCLNGDTVTGTDIYDNQHFEVSLGLYEQVFLAAKLHFKEILRLAEIVPEVHVHFQPGNHGKISDGEDAFNADRIAYGIIDLALRWNGPDNVYCRPPNEAGFTNFQARGYKFHMRHGQKYLEHVGTSSGKNRVRGDIINHGSRSIDGQPIDVILRNHYHQFKVEPDSGVEVVMGPSICPPADFEDWLSEYEGAAGAVIGVTDSAPVKWTEKVTLDIDPRDG